MAWKWRTFGHRDLHHCTPTSLPSPLSSPAGCGGVLRWLKHKNSDFGSENEVAPGQFSAQILSSWVREAKVQRRAASTIRNMFWAWGLEELKIGTCGLNYRTKGIGARKRNNFGKLGTVDQPEYCKQPQMLLLLSLPKRSKSCNRWPMHWMGIKYIAGLKLKMCSWQDDSCMVKIGVNSVLSETVQARKL